MTLENRHDAILYPSPICSHLSHRFMMSDASRMSPVNVQTSLYIARRRTVHTIILYRRPSNRPMSDDERMGCRTVDKCTLNCIRLGLCFCLRWAIVDETRCFFFFLIWKSSINQPCIMNILTRFLTTAMKVVYFINKCLIFAIKQMKMFVNKKIENIALFCFYLGDFVISGIMSSRWY